MIIKIIFKILFYSILFCTDIFAKDLEFSGNKKLSIDDLQSLTSININKSEFNSNEIQVILIELYNSELISNVSLIESQNSFILNIEESKFIENIYVNGNIYLNDSDIINNISSKSNKLFNKNTLLDDVSLIKRIYLSKGYDNISIKTSTEYYSEDRLNLIFEIYEGYQNKIIKIDFKGNEFFSDKYLQSLINSKEDSFFNFFSSGSNLDNSIFQFDVNLIQNKYLDYGFNEVLVSYELNVLSNSNNKTLTFYISEGPKYTINNINLNIITEELNLELQSKFNDFKDKLSKAQYQINKNEIKLFIAKLNKYLISIGNYKSVFNYEINFINDGFDVFIYEEDNEPLVVNSINIYGNNITKDSTIRNNIVIEPGDNYSETLVNESLQNLKEKKYIINSNANIKKNDQNVDIDIEIDENKKTGNFLIGGNYSGDNGLGFSSSLKDVNLFGTGNELNLNLSINEENLLYDLTYIYFPPNLNNISYRYKIYNLDRDLTNSYGYKSKELGASFSLNFDYSKDISFSSGLEFLNFKGYSAQSNLNFINDNIKSFNQYILNFSLSYDTSNDVFYPTNGYKNSIFIKFIPNQISTLPLFSINFQNESYFEFQNSSDFIFNINKIGYIDTLDSNDKVNTINAFSLGGLSLKGFDYRGIGPESSNYYLGGNKFFTSTFGYGSSFLLDEDQFKIKLFYSIGSLWDSDYTNDNNFKLRSAAGVSIDIMTPLLPISLSYAIPIVKDPSDRTRNFNFSIGTSF